MFNCFVMSCTQKVELYRMPRLELPKDEMIYLTICALASLITSRWSDKPVASVTPVIKPLIYVTALTNV